ncbi:MAG: membrane protein insertion efficiency factor YidD [Bacteroidota bacterium]
MKYLILVLYFFFTTFAALSQNSLQNLLLVEQSLNSTITKVDTLNTKKTIKPSRGNFVMRYNPVSLFFIGAMFVYQNAISAQLSASCVYEQSCSNFSKNMISEFGFIKGLLLSSDRLIRCNPKSIEKAYEWEINENQGKLLDDTSNYK